MIPSAPIAEHRSAIEKYLRELPSSALFKEILEAKKSSMLHWKTLALLHFYSERAEGAVLELGPYLGASAAVMAKAAKDQNFPVITVEVGGAHDHPQLPSEDILGDLRRNLRTAGVADRVCLIEGSSADPAVFRRIRDALGELNIGLLVIDTDGHVDRDLKLFSPLCREFCYLAVDDYVVPDKSTLAVLKENRIKPYVDDLVQHGKLREFGVFEWGTWFGQLSSRDF